MKKEFVDKNLILWTLIIIIPIIFTVVVMAVKSGGNDNTLEISRTTYVHVFSVKDTRVDIDVKETLSEIDDPYKIVYHDISEEGDLYKKVLELLGITEKVYNPLIMINDNYFTEEYDKYSLQNAIETANKIYSKKDLTNEEILKYNVVDRLNAGEEVFKAEDYNK